MKIQRTKFLSILIGYLFKKINGNEPSPQEITYLIPSVAPLINIYLNKLKEEGILDSEDRIDLSTFESKAREVFSVLPSIHVPHPRLQIVITINDLEALLKEAKQKADIDSQEVICLPC